MAQMWSAPSGRADPMRRAHRGPARRGRGLRGLALTLATAAATGAAPVATPGATPVAATGAATTADARLCEDWARVAAAEHGVPEALMQAIAFVETGRTVARRATAWPWTINVAGKGHWFAARQEAEAFLDRHLAAGGDAPDLGCFQLNLRWHGAAFAAPADMLEPARNARYAARFLAALHGELGDWTRATAAYHSRTTDLGRAYVGRVAAVLRDLDGGPDRARAPGRGPERARVAAAAVPLSAAPMPPAPGAATGWTRAPAPAARSGAPLGSLMPPPGARP